MVVVVYVSLRPKYTTEAAISLPPHVSLSFGRGWRCPIPGVIVLVPFHRVLLSRPFSESIRILASFYLLLKFPA